MLPLAAGISSKTYWGSEAKFERYILILSGHTNLTDF